LKRVEKELQENRNNLLLDDSIFFFIEISCFKTLRRRKYAQDAENPPRFGTL
jgi:hypothetical protein